MKKRTLWLVLVLCLIGFSAAFSRQQDQLVLEDIAMPAMNSEKEAYFHRYLEPLSQTGILMGDFDEQTIGAFDPVQAFQAISQPSPKSTDEDWIPQQQLEAALMKVLPVTTEQLRAFAGDEYHAQRQAYQVQKKQTEANYRGAVTAASMSHDILTLDCSWYELGQYTGQYDVLKARSTTRIRLQQDGFSFLSNRVKQY